VLHDAVGGTELITSGGSATGVAAISAGGLLETLAGGTAIIDSSFVNSGTLFASGGFIQIDSGVIVSGGVVNIGDGIVYAQGNSTASSSATVGFASTGAGGLLVDDAADQVAAFGGTITGFGGSGHSNQTQYIDLVSVTSDPTVSASFEEAPGNLSGTLTVTSNTGTTEVASIVLIGSYATSNFVLGAAADNSVLITDPSAVASGGHAANLALFGNY
jgi:hypothetical protein